TPLARRLSEAAESGGELGRERSRVAAEVARGDGGGDGLTALRARSEVRFERGGALRGQAAVDESSERLEVRMVLHVHTRWMMNRVARRNNTLTSTLDPAQLFARAVEDDAGVGGRYAERAADLLAGELLLVEELEREPVALGQASDRLLQASDLLAARRL